MNAPYLRRAIEVLDTPVEFQIPNDSARTIGMNASGSPLCTACRFHYMLLIKAILLLIDMSPYLHWWASLPRLGRLSGCMVEIIT